MCVICTLMFGRLVAQAGMFAFRRGSQALAELAPQSIGYDSISGLTRDEPICEDQCGHSGRPLVERMPRGFRHLTGVEHLFRFCPSRVLPIAMPDSTAKQSRGKVILDTGC
jgi:hypothetical protein